MNSTYKSVPGATRWEYTLNSERGEIIHRDRDDEIIGRIPWCPHVEHVYTLTDGDGHHIATRVRMSVFGQTEIIDMGDVVDGSAWPRYRYAAGSAGYSARQILADIVHDQISRIEPIPLVAAWGTGRQLTLPPADVLPPGYRMCSESERTARKAWQQIAAYCALNPKLALVLGAALGGLFVEPLRGQSCWVHLTGASSQGKTTALKVASALFGDPAEVITPWNGSIIGTGVLLGELGCLTAFRDEMDAGHLSKEQLKALVFRTTEGNRRLTSTRDGRMRRSRPWKGILISTGNVTVRGRLADNEGVAGRVIELETPILSDAATAETLELELAPDGAGWPLEWFTAHIRALGETGRSQALRQAVDAAQADLGVESGGVLRRTGQQLAMCVAGAAFLDEMFGTETIRPAAVAAAREAAADLARELAEAGASPLERLLAAIQEDMGTDPASWPSRSALSARQIDIPITGLDLGDDNDIAGDIAIWPNRLRQLAARHDISDVIPAIRQGTRTGQILTESDESCNGRRRAQVKIRINGIRNRMYVFSLRELEPEMVGPVGPPPQNPRPDPGPTGPTTGGAGGGATGGAGVGPPDKTPQISGAGWTRELDPRPCISCGTITTARNPQGDPQHYLAECQTPAARRMESDLEMAGWRRSVAEVAPEAGAELVAAALGHWKRATGGITWMSSPPATGLQWFHAVQAKHGKAPDLEKLPPVTLEGNVRRYTDKIAPIGADLPNDTLTGHYVIGLDVNAQYLATTESVVLGSGAPERVDGKHLPRDLYKLPGYVRYDDSPDEWVPMPLARLWNRAMESVTEALIWRDGRRWLAPWGKAGKAARAALMEHAAADEAAALALAMLKRTYSGFLGGMLRSDRHNHSSALRPDWSDQVVALATANQERAQRGSRPAPIGHMRDTAWWLLDDPAALPAGITISEQCGKWKHAGICIVTESLMSAWESGRPAKFRDAFNFAKVEPL